MATHLNTMFIGIFAIHNSSKTRICARERRSMSPSTCARASARSSSDSQSSGSGRGRAWKRYKRMHNLYLIIVPNVLDIGTWRGVVCASLRSYFREMSEHISCLGVQRYVTAEMRLMKTGGAGWARGAGSGVRGATDHADCFITICITSRTLLYSYSSREKVYNRQLLLCRPHRLRSLMKFRRSLHADGTYIPITHRRILFLR